jgi:hypothetical protein
MPQKRTRQTGKRVEDIKPRTPKRQKLKDLEAREEDAKAVKGGYLEQDNLRRLKF